MSYNTFKQLILLVFLLYLQSTSRPKNTTLAEMAGFRDGTRHHKSVTYPQKKRQPWPWSPTFRAPAELRRSAQIVQIRASHADIHLGRIFWLNK